GPCCRGDDSRREASGGAAGTGIRTAYRPHQLPPSSSPRKRGPSRLQRRKTEVLGQVAPAEVVAFDQLELPHPQPLLDPLLAHDRVLHRGVRLEPDEAPDPVPAGEAGRRPFAVLVDA